MGVIQSLSFTSDGGNKTLYFWFEECENPHFSIISDSTDWLTVDINVENSTLYIVVRPYSDTETDREGNLIYYMGETECGRITVTQSHAGGGGGGTYWDTGLPVVVINTPGGQPITSKEDWMEGASIKIYENRQSILYESDALAIRGRGNSTWTYAKKPYALKLDEKSEIFGMAQSKRWCLLANYYDRTHMRNDIALKLGNAAYETDWSPSGRFVELVLNGEHLGNYYFCEQIRVEDTRVNIRKKIDYLLEIDSYYDEPYKFTSSVVKYFYNIKNPEEPYVNVDFISSKINNFETLLYNNGNYEPYVDFDSFIDYWFVVEFTDLLEVRRSYESDCTTFREGNIGPHSMYLQYIVGENGGQDKIKMGPIWDFDEGTFEKYFIPSYHFCIDGLPTTEEGHTLTDFYIPDKKIASDIPYYDVLFENDNFKQRVKQRWNTVRPKFAQIFNEIENNYTMLKKSDELNTAMWPIDCGRHFPDGCYSFRNAVDLMKEVCQLRLNYMDDFINNL